MSFILENFKSWILQSYATKHLNFVLYRLEKCFNGVIKPKPPSHSHTPNKAPEVPHKSQWHLSHGYIKFLANGRERKRAL